MSGNFQETLLQFENVLVEIGHPTLEKLQPGLSPEYIELELKKIGISNNYSLIQLYSWRNGLLDNPDRKIGELELFNNNIMLSLPLAINHYQIALANKNLSRNLFPIFSNGAGVYLLLDINKNSGKDSPIMIFSPTVLLSESPQLTYKDLNSMFETLTECYKEEAYIVNEEGYIDVDYDLEQEISRRINPDAEFWN